MVNLNGTNMCECCFSVLKKEPCDYCGYSKRNYTPDNYTLPIGSILAGKYIIGGVLGKGGFGITYIAYDTNRQEKIALKEYYPYGMAFRLEDHTSISTTSSEFTDTFLMGAEKFFEEAKLVSKFNGNPNIVSVYEFFYENNTAYFAMEYLKGIELKDYVKEHGGKIPESEALYIMQRVSDALMITQRRSVTSRYLSR